MLLFSATSMSSINHNPSRTEHTRATLSIPNRFESTALLRHTATLLQPLTGNTMGLLCSGSNRYPKAVFE